MVTHASGKDLVLGFQHRVGGAGILLGKSCKLEAARFPISKLHCPFDCKIVRSAVVFVPPEHHDVDTEAPLLIAMQNNTLFFSLLASL